MSDKFTVEVKFVLPEYRLRNINLEGVRPGEKLKGKVVLRPLQNIKCRGVWLEIGYMERGQGTHHDNKMVEIMIYEGNLRQNQYVDKDIDFIVPEIAPITYKGQYVEIAWYVRTRIDIPLWFDMRNEFYFKVLPHLVRTRDEVDTRLLRKMSGYE